ncbi:MAG: sulfur carrier protein ThiS [Bacteroides sp.]|nr:sulfur carrier protein ThiS [Bacteroides sp.]MCM1086339.1 sulfur carrier protein ThiS [Bacteroides sp.]MCM1168952.1 sulfur carrier protein ThiS [Bacteroides sp.]
MNIFLNDKPLLIEDGTTLAGLMRSKNLLSQSGIALALNNSVVPKEKWEHTVLHENDMLLLIGASYGG